jgi:hypothetical protein
MRSYAHVSGKQGSLTAEVGGPAALFVLVVAGAFYLTRPPDTFSLIIRVGSEIDATALQGVKVTVDLGDRREPKEFSATGEAEIHGVSALLVGKQVPIHLSLSRLHLNTTTVLIPPRPHYQSRGHRGSSQPVTSCLRGALQGAGFDTNTMADLGLAT